MLVYRNPANGVSHWRGGDPAIRDGREAALTRRCRTAQPPQRSSPRNLIARAAGIPNALAVRVLDTPLVLDTQKQSIN